MLLLIHNQIAHSKTMSDKAKSINGKSKPIKKSEHNPSVEKLTKEEKAKRDAERERQKAEREKYMAQIDIDEVNRLDLELHAKNKKAESPTKPDTKAILERIREEKKKEDEIKERIFEIMSDPVKSKEWMKRIQESQRKTQKEYAEFLKQRQKTEKEQRKELLSQKSKRSKSSE